ncbi:alpha-2,8-sialyltransferase 8E-like isoform X2 [Ptychodera flava]|uniref:alpha-2,8-sialyltransferase 8E-like isoform X2 n=1 Tax=Ptychodera flava TaxID=63121 RepID=UPI003969DC1D
MEKLRGFCCLLPNHVMRNILRIMLLILCCYCIVITVMTTYSRLSPIKITDYRRLETSSIRNCSCHSYYNKTSIQVTLETDITNATTLNKTSKIFKETSKTDVKNDSRKFEENKLQASKQLITNTSQTSEKKQSVSAIDVYKNIEKDWTFNATVAEETSKTDVKNDSRKFEENKLQASKQLITNTSQTSEKKQSVSAIDVYNSIEKDWTFNATAAEELRGLLEQKCNTSGMCFTSHDSVKINDTLHYLAVKHSMLMTSTILDRFPKKSPYKLNSFNKCSIVASSGILLGSQCGKEIDSADFIVRYLSSTKNITEKFRQHILTEYGNTTLYIPAFVCEACTGLALRAQDVLESTHVNVVFPHPSHMLSVRKFWRGHGIKSNQLSSGLMLMTSFLSFCQEVHLFGFWPFQVDKHGTPLPFHYYDPKHIPQPSRVAGIVHNMPSELNTFINLHNKGIIRLHVDKC